MNYITFDIETYSPSNLNRIDTNEFRVSVAGAYISWIDEYIAFLEDDINDLIDLMSKADLIIGFNHIWFDLPVMQKYASFDLLQLPNYDLIVEFSKVAGFKPKLNDLCKANFGDDIKTDSYEQYKHYYKDKKWYELIDYCMNDVRLTEKLFRKTMQQNPVLFKDLHETKDVILALPKPGKIFINNTTQSQSIF
jgi:DEAD/DEAH box helicase domain-containing protein